MSKLPEFMNRSCILIYLANFVFLENTLASLLFTFAQRKSLKFVPPMMREHVNCTEVALGRTSKCYVRASEGEGALLCLFRFIRLWVPNSYPSYLIKRCVFSAFPRTRLIACILRRRFFAFVFVSCHERDVHED